MSVTRYHCQHAWLPSGVADDVLVEIAGGRFVAVRAQTPVDAVEAAGAVRLVGLTLPGLANAHSHAFHRALRGRSQRGRGTFWTWREQMYAVAGALDPDSYHALAVAVYAEMALAGITCVGEFHYLHHGPGGVKYADPNAMGEALIAAAADAGIRITLLDTLYLTAGVDGRALEGVQLRFGDGSIDAWSNRLDRLRPRPHARIGAAAHSVRAVPAEVLAAFASRTDGLPTHVHLSEQRAENEACLAVHGRTPTELLADRGLLGGRLTAVHATHLSDTDRTELGDSGTGVCFCPTTERDLADGIGHARALVDSGSPLSLGSDSHAVIDLFEEARGVEMHERLHTEHRGHFTGAELITAATVAGHAALGWLHAGSIAVGGRADLVTVALDSARTAGCDPAAIAFAATAADVRHAVVDGRVVVRDGTHAGVPDVGAALTNALEVIAEARGRAPSGERRGDSGGPSGPSAGPGSGAAGGGLGSAKSGGPKDSAHDGQEDPAPDSQEDAARDSREDAVPNSREDAARDGQEDAARDGQEDAVHNGQEDAAREGPEDAMRYDGAGNVAGIAGDQADGEARGGAGVGVRRGGVDDGGRIGVAR